VGSQNVSQQDVVALLLKVSQHVASGSTIDYSIPAILDGIQRLTNAVLVRLVLVQPTETIVFASGLKVPDLQAVDIPLHIHAQANEAVTLTSFDGLDTTLKFATFAEFFRSLMAFPLELSDEAQQATLWMAFEEGAGLENADYEVLNLLALQAVIAINSAYTLAVAEIEHQQREALLANDVEPIIIVDTDFQIRVFNAAAEKLFAVSAEFALGRPFAEVIQSQMLQDMLNAGTNARPDAEYMADNGMTFSPHVSQVVARDGSEHGWLMVLRDVTRFKNLSENMSNFLHTVSHDIRSPMTAAKGYVDMLRMVGQVNDKQDIFIQKTLTSIRDMTNLVEKVLDAGRLDPEMDVYEIRRETTDPTAIIAKVVSTLTAAAEQNSITLTSEVSPNVPVMYIDELMTERAITNLVENAIKYSPPGGKVHIGAKVEDDMLVLSVADNGYGISQEDQERLFERGQRVRRKEHKGIRGSGLGLFIVRNVARKHKGFANVESEVGNGSTFSISIPLIPENLVGGGQPGTKPGGNSANRNTDTASK
jgi:two-component system, OmpR family, phosphate regulon sensor histidine kinase PhoR